MARDLLLLPVMPSATAVATALPDHRYGQGELTEAVLALLPNLGNKIDVARRLFERVGVRERHLALPLEVYAELKGFSDRNRAWLEVASTLTERAVRRVLNRVGLQPRDIGLLETTTITGIAVPSLDARLMNQLEFSPDLKRLPIFGLGCVAGAAGVARVSEYLRAYPDQAALFVSVELCSLTSQTDDCSVANLISSSLFGDGAAAVLMVGDHHPLAPRGVEIRGSRSVFFPNTEDAMGWEIVDSGFKIVLGPQVPSLAREGLAPAVDDLLATHNLTREDIAVWVAHPGGPKVLDAMRDGLGLAESALDIPRENLRSIGNLSSASVLFILESFLGEDRPEEGSHGIMLAMGPAFCAELVVLHF